MISAGTHFGRYEISSKLGEGGMGEVYAARDPELDRPVAIKLLPREFTNDADRRSRFRQEARVVSALNHPNIITIYEVGENEEGSFLATEFVEGVTLRELLKQERPSLTKTLRIVEQAANALAAAHEAGIVHRDVKPENIMVRQDSIVKVLDFGLAKTKAPLGDLEGEETNKTVPGTVMGSARYMSPEQARGLEIDERTDIWSLGVVLYEMLIGSAPFDGETTADTIASVVYKEPAPLSDLLPSVPAELNRIARKALQKDRDERYQNVKDLALDLRGLIRELDNVNSGERSGQDTSSAGFSENPTMIHGSASSEHLLEGAKTVISFRNGPLASGRVGDVLKLIGAAVILMAIGVVAVLGFKTFFASEPSMSVRAFERSQSTRINTDGTVVFPAISPDGKYIAYASGEVGSRSLVVRQIAAESSITVVPPSNLNIQAIRFSPSGDHIYYTQTNGDMAVNTLYEVPTLGGPSKKLLTDVDSVITFSPDGKRFAFVRHIPKTSEDVIIMADMGTMATEPLISSKDAGYSFFVNKIAWSPDGETILAGAGHRQSGFVTATDVLGISVENRTFKRLTDREYFTAHNFAWFADGSGFVFTARETQNDPSQIWRADMPSGLVFQITNDFNDYADLGISDDGRSILTIKGETTGALWRYSVSGRTAQQLTADNRNVFGMYGIMETADGNLLFTRTEAKESDLWISDGDAREPKAFHTEDGYSIGPDQTADGRYIVFNLQKDRSSRIWRMNADGTGPIMLTGGNDDVIDVNPQVTPDGKHVVFQRKYGNDDRFRIMHVSIEGGDAEVLYEDEDRAVFLPRVSADGRRIAFGAYQMSTFERKLVIATLENGKLGRIEHEHSVELMSRFTWSPDSRNLTILTNRGGIQNLWRQPVEGGEPEPITNFKSGRIFSFSWARDGRSILIARGSTNNDLILIRDTSGGERNDVSRRNTTFRKRAAI